MFATTDTGRHVGLPLQNQPSQQHRGQRDGEVVHVSKGERLDCGGRQRENRQRDEVPAKRSGEDAGGDVNPQDEGREDESADQHADGSDHRFFAAPRQFGRGDAAANDVGDAVTAAHQHEGGHADGGIPPEQKRQNHEDDAVEKRAA